MSESESGSEGLKPHLIAGLVGFVVAIGIVLGSNPDMLVPFSAWSYYWLGWPLMCLATAWLARTWPQRSWRWPTSMAVGQVFGTIFTDAGTMVPITMLYTLLLSIPQFVVANAVTQRVLAAHDLSVQEEEDKTS